MKDDAPGAPTAAPTPSYRFGRKTVEEGPLYGIEAVRKNQERWWEAWENSETTLEEVIGVETACL